MTLKKPEPLNAVHDVSTFNCGHQELDDWVKKYAHQARANGSANTFIVCDNNQVVGYYSLTVGEVRNDEVSEQISKGMGKYPIPVVILARLAVQSSHQGLGVGKGMLKAAILGAIIIAEHAAVRALLVHAIDDEAYKFYLKFGFEPSPIRTNQLVLLLKDARKKITQ
jgi:GNAT superfamily N-acetyltransferase